MKRWLLTSYMKMKVEWAQAEADFKMHSFSPLCGRYGR